MDAQDKIVAVTKDCNIPSSLLEKEFVGESGREADIERILEIKPDLVIAKTGRAIEHQPGIPELLR